jgi:hypothetical protein
MNQPWLSSQPEGKYYPTNNFGVSKYDREELIGRRDHQFINSDLSFQNLCVSGQRFANGEIWKGEVKTKKVDNILGRCYSSIFDGKR